MIKIFFPSLPKYRSPFHKTLPKSSSQMHWILVRFYEMGDILYFDINLIKTSLIKTANFFFINKILVVFLFELTVCC